MNKLQDFVVVHYEDILAIIFDFLDTLHSMIGCKTNCYIFINTFL